MNYFKKWTPTRKWRSILAIGLPALGLLWLMGLGVARNNAPYSSGPLSTSHAFMGSQCNTCHQPIAMGVGFRKHVSDDSCLACHQAPMHQASQTFTPSCASCHVEHVGSTNLAHASDRSCTQCHSNLQIKSGAHIYQADIKGFNLNHPEFAPLRAGFRDPGSIKFNHAMHLKAGLQTEGGKPVQLECADCHRSSGMGQTWKYGEVALKTPGTPAKPGAGGGMMMPETESRPSDAEGPSRASYMKPPTYENNCIACHSLQFDPAISQPAPHDKPEMVHAFVVQKLTEYIGAHPGAIREGTAELQIPRGAFNRGTAHNASEWVTLHTAQAEDLLWRKTCLECHVLTQRAADASATTALPVVAEANVSTRWLPHAVFQHYAHSSLTCESCHTKAPSSTETSDVLLPGIATCQTCHRDAREKIAAANNSCSLCHQYHDWKEGKPIKGKYSLQQLVGGVMMPAPHGEVASR